VTPEEIATLPDDLLAAAHARPGAAELLRSAAERICALEEEVLALRREADRLRGLVRGHRGRRDFMGGKEQCDLDLWTAALGDGPWGRDVEGDG
jgi:hypothetical protein